MESGAKNSDIAKKYCIPTSTISSIYKNKATILAAFENCPQLKKLRKCEKEDLNRCLLQWYRTNKEAGYNINGSILNKQADKFAKQLGYGFSCSSGWLARFKNRNNVVYAKATEEINAPDAEMTDEWVQFVYPELLRSYKLENIYCACRFSINTNSEADEHLEVLLCTNLTGTDKKNVLILKDNVKDTVSFSKISEERVFFYNCISQATIDALKTHMAKWSYEAGLTSKKIILLTEEVLVIQAIQNFPYLKVASSPLLLPLHVCAMSAFEGQEISLQNPNPGPTLLEFLNNAWVSLDSTTVMESFQKFGVIIKTHDDDNACDQILDEPKEQKNLEFVEVNKNPFVKIEHTILDEHVDKQLSSLDEAVVKKEFEENASGYKCEEMDNTVPNSPITHSEATNALETLECFCVNSERCDISVINALSVIRNFLSTEFEEKLIL